MEAMDSDAKKIMARKWLTVKDVANKLRRALSRAYYLVTIALITGLIATGPAGSAIVPSDDPDLARCLQNLERANNSKDQGAITDALFAIGKRYADLDDNADAVKYFRQSLELERTQKRRNRQIDAANARFIEPPKTSPHPGDYGTRPAA